MASDFTPAIQLKILAWFCYDFEEAKYWVSYLEPDLFEFSSLQWISKCIRRSYEKLNKPPTRDQIESDYILTDTDFDGQDASLYIGFLELIEEGFDEIEYIRDMFPHYVRSWELRRTLHDNEDKLNDGDWDGLRTALKVKEPQFNRSILDQVDIFSVRVFEELFNKGNAIPTGVPLIDNELGGLYKKELMLILGDTNVGKSLLMTSVGAEALKAGLRVLHISLEMGIGWSMLRYAVATDPDRELTVSDFRSLNDPERIVNHMAYMREKFEGRFYLIQLPTGLGTIEDIERIVDQTEPDLLILDYLDLLKPLARRDARRFEIAELAMVTRGLAVQGDYHLLSASQTNRGGHNTRIVEVDVASEDYDKMRTADNVISLGQTRIDIQRQQVVMYVAKARNTRKGVAHRYFIDFPHMRFTYMQPELIYNRETANGAASQRRNSSNNNPDSSYDY
jgi:replicative DNA helicase